ncbi:MAG: hypothetical protein WA136_11505 [Rhodoferax sp.]
MISLRQVLRLALIGAAGAVYLGLGYLAAASDHPPVIALVVGLAPLGAAALAMAWKARARAVALTLCAACAVAIMLYADQLLSHVAWLFFVQHAGAMTLLGIMFGSTLGNGHAQALCSRIARFLLPTPLDAAYLHYTWKVTLAWTVFFLGSASLSALLFFLGPMEAWSAFANLLTPVLLGAMFGGEYLIRLRALPNREHFSIAQTIQAYREYARRR